MKTFVTWLAVLIMAFTFGCTKPKEEGTAEKAGKLSAAPSRKRKAPPRKRGHI